MKTPYALSVMVSQRGISLFLLLFRLTQMAMQPHFQEDVEDAGLGAVPVQGDSEEYMPSSPFQQLGSSSPISITLELLG